MYRNCAPLYPFPPLPALFCPAPPRPALPRLASSCLTWSCCLITKENEVPCSLIWFSSLQSCFPDQCTVSQCSFILLLPSSPFYFIFSPLYSSLHIISSSSLSSHILCSPFLHFSFVLLVSKLSLLFLLRFSILFFFYLSFPGLSSYFFFCPIFLISSLLVSFPLPYTIPSLYYNCTPSH